ncbi:unnamed protein product [Ectocarpus sp. 8 AP-2014]
MSLQFELKSAFSVKISWDAFGESDAYTVQWTQSSVQKETTVSTSAIALVNLEPDTSYSVCVTSPSSDTVVSNSFQTWSLDDPHLENLYASVRLEDGTYDATQFDTSAHDVFLKYFNDIVQNGDTIYASVILKGAPKNIETRAVTEGSTTDVAGDQNLFLPFSKDSSSAQIVTLSNSVPIDDVEGTSAADVAVAQELGGDVELLYTPESDTFTIGDSVFGVGDKFSLFGKMVTVADGSIVLVFEDTVAKVYPFNTSTASNVLGTLGSQFAKNFTCNVINVVGSKTTGVSGNTYSSSWVYDTETDTIAEATRIVHEIDEDSANGTISIGVRHTDANSNTFIEPVVSCASGSTIISAQDDSDNTVSTTIDPTGISFDTDDACIYFGAAQKFRIIFRDGTPSTLAIESYDADTGTYMTRSEFSDAT